MNDGSIFNGKFENKTMVDGMFRHFTGLKFKGMFNKEKFFKGELKFIDGEKLKGEWGNKRGRWVLKQGLLYNEKEE